MPIPVVISLVGRSAGLLAGPDVALQAPWEAETEAASHRSSRAHALAGPSERLTSVDGGAAVVGCLEQSTA